MQLSLYIPAHLKRVVKLYRVIYVRKLACPVRCAVLLKDQLANIRTRGRQQLQF